MSTVVYDISAFSQNLVKMRIFLGSSSHKCEKMRESPFENQTKLNQKVLLEKNLKMSRSLTLPEDFKDQELLCGTGTLGFQSTRILVGWSRARGWEAE